MNEKSLEISIIMATWNRSHLITETLKSIANQNFTNWECLIIDDGSSDNTNLVVEQFAASDPRFIFESRKPKYKKGLPGCRNQGLDRARGQFIVFFDDDDIVHPKNLEVCFSLLMDKHIFFCRYDKNPFYENTGNIVFEDVQNFDITPFYKNDLDKMITGETPFASCCVMWNKRCFEQERYNEELMYAEEWECYSRILAKGFEGVSINQILYFNRKHENSNTGEFHNNNSTRTESKIKAALLIEENFISQKKYLSPTLRKFFIRLGFSLKSYKIIQKALVASGASKIELVKYKLGFLFYPLLRPLFIAKGKLKGIQNFKDS